MKDIYKGDMGQKCKICSSSHQPIYEKMIKTDDKTLNEVKKIAKEKYDEEFSTASLSRHMNNHFNRDKRLEQAIDERGAIREEIGSALDVITELRSNLKILRQMLDQMVNSDKELTTQKIRASQSCISEIRQTLTTLSDLTNKLKIEDAGVKSEKDEFYEAIDNLEPEMAQAIVEVIDSDLEG